MKIITFIIIHLLIPLIGLFFFLSINRKMKIRQISNPPIFELFVLFVTYGGLLLMLLTVLFWEISGMSILGLFYLMCIAPFLMGLIFYRVKKNQKTSIFHQKIFQFSYLYFIIAPLTLLVLFFIGNIKR